MMPDSEQEALEILEEVLSRLDECVVIELADGAREIILPPLTEVTPP